MKRNNLWLIVLFISLVLPFYLGGLLIGVHGGGDLPFFYPENLLDLMHPWAWMSAPGPNGLGFSNTATLWLYLPFLFFGFLYQVLHIDFTYSFSLALMGYLMLSVFSITMITRVFQISFLGRLIAVTIYLLNSYILLLIDGGQMIFAIGYALLPIFIYTTILALNKRKLYLVLLSSIMLSILIGIDIRIALLSALFLIIYQLFHFDYVFKNTKFFVLTGVLFISIFLLIHAYWIIPLLYQSQESLPFINEFGLNNLSSIKIDDALLLHQPQWPNNIFGEIQSASIYFSLLPLLVFVNLLFKQTKLTLMLNVAAIISIFLAKGANPPFGEVNIFLNNQLPLFNLFRDPSKFFVLLALIFALLAGISYDHLASLLIRFKSIRKRLATGTLFIVFILAVILPVSDGHYQRLKGLLSGTTEISNLHRLIIGEGGFFRSLWINQKPQSAFSDNERPALDIKSLSENPFIKSISLDGYDLTSFLRTNLGRDVLNIVGVKYLALDELNSTKQSEIERRTSLTSFFDKQNWLTGRFDKGTFYEAKDYNDRFVALKSIFLVNDGLDLYNYLSFVPGFSLTNNGFIFLNQINNLEINRLNNYIFLTTNDEIDTRYDLISNQMELTFPMTGQGSWGSTTLAGDLWRRLLKEKNVTSVNYYPNTQEVIYSTIQNESFLFDNVNSKYGSLLVQLFSNRRGGSVEFELNNEKFTINTKSDIDRFEWFEVPIFVNGSIKIINKGGFNAVGKIIKKPDNDVTRNLDAMIQGSRIYLINTRGDRKLKFSEDKLYKAALISNSAGKVFFKKGERAVSSLSIDKIGEWKDAGLIKSSDIDGISIEGSQSGRILLDKTYTEFDIEKSKGIRIVFKEADRKEIGVEWNSIKTEKVDVSPNSVLNIELSKDIILRAHLFKGDVEAYEVEVPITKDGLKLGVPHEFDGIQFELLWPKNANPDKLLFKATYEGDQETSLLLYPQELNLESIFNQEQKAVSWRYINPTKYEVTAKEPYYLLFSEKYNPNWQIKGADYQGSSVQTFGLINGFYIPKAGSYTVEYTTQKLVDRYLILSAISFVFISLMMAVLYRKDI